MISEEIPEKIFKEILKLFLEDYGIIIGEESWVLLSWLFNFKRCVWECGIYQMLQQSFRWGYRKVFW